QARPLRACERSQPLAREGTVLVDQRDDVRDRRESYEVLVFLQTDTERLRQLRDDAGAAELGKRILGRPRRDDGAVRQRLTRAMVVRDDDLEPARFGPRDLLDRGDAAVDG